MDHCRDAGETWAARQLHAARADALALAHQANAHLTGQQLNNYLSYEGNPFGNWAESTAARSGVAPARAPIQEAVREPGGRRVE